MRLFYKSPNGDVYEYASEQEREQYGASDLVLMTEQEVEDHLNPVSPVIIPEKVTMRQARLALLSQGLLDSVETALANLEGDAGTAARIEWEYSAEVWRYKPFVVQVATVLGLSDEQLDDLFILAASVD